jgi:hypothetical protein
MPLIYGIVIIRFDGKKRKGYDNMALMRFLTPAIMLLSMSGASFAQEAQPAPTAAIPIVAVHALEKTVQQQTESYGQTP